MPISELISKLQAIKDEHGDLDVFDDENFSIERVGVYEVDPKDYPEDWNMPNKLVRVYGG